MALVGLPSAPEVEITDAALNSLLDALEGCVGAHHPQLQTLRRKLKISLDPRAVGGADAL
jgi:hypothetical protein